jgi:Mn2+/Fe2+ NRAMP family transporter
MLLVISRKKIEGYKHATWLKITGWGVVAVMSYMSFITIKGWLS